MNIATKTILSILFSGLIFNSYLMEKQKNNVNNVNNVKIFNLEDLQEFLNNNNVDDESTQKANSEVVEFLQKEKEKKNKIMENCNKIINNDIKQYNDILNSFLKEPSKAKEFIFFIRNQLEYKNFEQFKQFVIDIAGSTRKKRRPLDLLLKNINNAIFGINHKNLISYKNIKEKQIKEIPQYNGFSTENVFVFLTKFKEHKNKIELINMIKI